jgi:hypothetical protein
MAGYKLNLISANNETNIDNFFNSTAIVNIPIPFSKDLKSIMEFNGNLISARVYAQSKRQASKLVLELFQQLENLKLGKIKSMKNKKGPISIIFEKINFESIQNNPDLVALIETLNIDFVVFKNSYSKSNIIGNNF